MRSVVFARSGCYTNRHIIAPYICGSVPNVFAFINISFDHFLLCKRRVCKLCCICSFALFATGRVFCFLTCSIYDLSLDMRSISFACSGSNANRAVAAPTISRSVPIVFERGNVRLCQFLLFKYSICKLGCIQSFSLFLTGRVFYFSACCIRGLGLYVSDIVFACSYCRAGRPVRTPFVCGSVPVMIRCS